jgi:hypothetical protein
MSAEDLEARLEQEQAAKRMSCRYGRFGNELKTTLLTSSGKALLGVFQQLIRYT